MFPFQLFHNQFHKLFAPSQPINNNQKQQDIHHPSRKKFPFTSFIAGGGSCMVAGFLTNPIDVTKIRMQLDKELVASTNSALHSSKYKNPFHGLYVIAAEEGPRGLFAGATASVLREASYSTLRLGLYPFFKQWLADAEHIQLHYGKSSEPLHIKIGAGLCSGMIGAAIFNPFDLVKVRYQAAALTTPYRSVPHAFKSIMAKEGGFRGLYTGVWPTTFRAGLLTGVQVGSYDYIKHFFLDSLDFQDTAFTHLLSATSAGFFSSLATATIDQIKTRVMNDAMKATPQYKNSFDCFLKTFQSEGLFGLFKGFTAQWLRIGPHTMINFLIAEQILKGLDWVANH